MANVTDDTVAGFSLTNRWLLYTSVMLTPAQFASGIGSNAPTNLGFLAYNWYTQIQWYQNVQARELNALSLLLPHFNLCYAISYIGGVTSGNIYMGLLLGLGSFGVMVLNTVSAWVGWATNQPTGFGEYQFFFFGWRTLTDGWHKFFLLWQIFDSMLALSCGIYAVNMAVAATMADPDAKLFMGFSKATLQKYRYPAILVGAVLMLIFFWPLIMWTELIVARNQIESPTDMVAVWLFVGQAALMLLPSWIFCGLL